MADFPSDPVSPNISGQATWFSVASSDGGATVLAANPARKIGVWLKNAGANPIFIGPDTNATHRVNQQAAASFPSWEFIPGTGPIVAKAVSGGSQGLATGFWI
ncbi:MAG TPA: hypothetical protein VFD43_00280 [Planctomycetota bacterium]|nr:hypothetical protein [Planctomycetota bacterium]